MNLIGPKLFKVNELLLKSKIWRCLDILINSESKSIFFYELSGYIFDN